MNKIRYPFDEKPIKGDWIAVAPGVYWLQMALPMALDHINLYVLDSPSGWWIVDTGMKVGDTRECWEQLFAGPMQGKPVVGVICTHMHPDHIGQAGWLCEHWRVPLYMSFGEYLAARAFAEVKGGSLSWTTEEFYLRAGVPQEHLTAAGKKFRGFSHIIEPVPTSYRRLRDGDHLTIGDRCWQVITGSGHSPEHVCLYSASDKLLLAGDQIIPRITSNVSVMPTEPEGNPLEDWLASLRKFKRSIAEDTLVLPAHNAPFYGVKTRLEDLLAHHEGHLAAIEEACVEPKRAMDLLGVLFSRRLAASQISLALGEAIAHLNYLMIEGRLQRTLHEDGVYRYQNLYPGAPRFRGQIDRSAPLMEV